MSAPLQRGDIRKRDMCSILGCGVKPSSSAAIFQTFEAGIANAISRFK